MAPRLSDFSVENNAGSQYDINRYFTPSCQRRIVTKEIISAVKSSQFWFEMKFAFFVIKSVFSCPREFSVVMMEADQGVQSPGNIISWYSKYISEMINELYTSPHHKLSLAA